MVWCPQESFCVKCRNGGQTENHEENKCDRYASIAGGEKVCRIRASPKPSVLFKGSKFGRWSMTGMAVLGEEVKTVDLNGIISW
jgi:hypothetical protein